jgi:hypothetical protein
MPASQTEYLFPFQLHEVNHRVLLSIVSVTLATKPNRSLTTSLTTPQTLF